MELDVVGCRPPRSAPDFVRVHGFVSKATAAGRAALNGIFARAHVLILPTGSSEEIEAEIDDPEDDHELDVLPAVAQEQLEHLLRGGLELTTRPAPVAETPRARRGLGRIRA